MGEAPATPATPTPEVVYVPKAEFDALKRQVEVQSGLLGSIDGKLKKLPTEPAEPTNAAKTPVEQRVTNLEKQLADEKKQTRLNKLGTAIVDHLADKVISRKVARDLAKLQVEKLKDSAVVFNEEGAATIGEGEAASGLTTYLDTLLETELADYKPAKANPSRDGLSAGGRNGLPSATKGYHRGANGVIVVEPIKIGQ
jgi:hypothetical protein